MGFNVGDTVKILDEEGEGVIIRLISENAALVDLDGLDFEFELSNLVKVRADNKIVHQADKKDFDYLLNKPKPNNLKEVLQHIPINPLDNLSTQGAPEIDLHIHQLVDKPRDLTNSEMLAIQIQRLEHFIHDCTVQSIREFVIIHGVGEGVLRTEVHKVLVSHGNIEFVDADYREYGIGATKARIRGLFA